MTSERERYDRLVRRHQEFTEQLSRMRTDHKYYDATRLYVSLLDDKLFEIELRYARGGEGA